jgi:glyoxylase-like metal-dependent hydrolase (beta-lactamase superfamily II)
MSEVTLPDQHSRAGAASVVFGLVIHHPRGPVLVDSGVGVGHETIDRLFSPVHRPLDQALAGTGISLSDVVMVINSHLHFDHCGNNRLFPGVPLVAQRTEYDLAHEPGYTITEWVDFPGADWVLIDGEEEVLPGITVLPMPSHTAGHQSVLVRSHGQLTDAEADQTAASARKIKAVDPVRVFFSHDTRIWQPAGDQRN